VSLLAPTLEAFFTGRLMTQKNASPHTIAAAARTTSPTKRTLIFPQSYSESSNIRLRQ